MAGSHHIFLFVVVVCCEMFTATLGVYLLIDGTTSNPIIVNTVSSWVRIPIFFITSLVLSKKWWKLWFRVDFLLVAYLSSAISYVFTLMSRAAANGLSPTDGWYVASDISYGLLMLAFVGNFRVMLKHFPFTSRSLWIYKIVRFYHALFFVVTFLSFGKLGGVSADTLAFFSVTLGLVNFLFIECVAVEDVFHAKRKAEKRLLNDDSRDSHAPLLDRSSSADEGVQSRSVSAKAK